MLSAHEAMAAFDGGLAAPFVPTDPQDVTRLLRALYGIEGRLTPQLAERDEIFRVTAGQGDFVLRICNPTESEMIVALRTAVLRHVQAVDPELPVPRIVTCTAGDNPRVALRDGTSRMVQLVSFIAGQPQSQSIRSRNQARNIGRSLARLALALQGFQHGADERYLAWDMAHAADLIPLVPASKEKRWQRVARIFAHFRDQIRPKLAQLRRQVVHNDFNPHNLILAEHDPARIVGIIDFGDCCRTQLVTDVAIAASYQLRPGDDGWAGARDVIAGYDEVNRLWDEEILLVFDLMLVRLATSITISEWRAQQATVERRPGILKNIVYAWEALDQLARLDRARAQDDLILAIKTGRAA